MSITLMLLAWLLFILGALLAVPAAVLSAEICAAVWLPQRRLPATAARRPANVNVAILVPAHNEETGIAATLRSVSVQLEPGDQVVVVADNCTDMTASLAEQEGAIVLVRHHETRRGKGYALDHGMHHLRLTPPDLVVILDADSILHPDALNHLIQQCVSSQQPVQAKYLMTPPVGAPTKTKVSAFAWLVKNHLRPLGAQKLGLPCQLTGSGMAFPWAVIEKANLASGHLVEDMQLGIQLAINGSPSQYCELATVTSQFPLSDEGLHSQRTRWEHGHLNMIFSTAPGLLMHAFRKRSIRLGALALDLCVPPLSSLGLMLLLVVALGLTLATTSPHQWAMIPAATALAALFCCVTAGWYQHGQSTLPARDALRIPAYIFAKVPLYLRYFTKRQVAWVRTRRDDGSR